MSAPKVRFGIGHRDIYEDLLFAISSLKAFGYADRKLAGIHTLLDTLAGGAQTAADLRHFGEYPAAGVCDRACSSNLCSLYLLEYLLICGAFG